MLKFKHINWENILTLSTEIISFLVIENKYNLWHYLQELLNASKGEITDYILFNDKYANLSIEKNLIVETNLAGITLNSKKLITALYKKCGLLALEPENEYEFRKQIKILYEHCKQISIDVGYDVVLSEDFEPVDVFKLFALEICENYKSILEKLVAYVNANIELLKSKIFIFLFLTKFLNGEELMQFSKHCEMQDVSLLLIEDSLPNEEYINGINYQVLVLDNDDCEILRKSL